MKTIKKLIICVCLLMCLTSCSEEELLSVEEENKNVYFLVDVKGKVKFPGIYTFDSEKYVYEIISIAGGLLDTANTSNLNLVQLISDNCTIEIQGKSDFVEDALININYASYEQLLLLPGIGTSYANKIIEYRKTIGLFKNIEEIKLIPGIKDNVFNQIKDKITV